LSQPVCVADYRTLARRRLPRVLFDYIDGGALNEDALARNTGDFQTLRLRQRALSGVQAVDLTTSLFGQALSMPLVLGPVGLTGMFRRRGEAKAARAARSAGITSCLSTVAICDVAEVAAAAGPVWFQLYMLRDRGLVTALLERAWAEGSRVLVLTVDVAVPGERLREQRAGLTGDLSALGHVRRALDGLAHPAWLHDTYLRGRPHQFGNIAALPGADSLGDFWKWIGAALEPGLTYAHVEWLRAQWPGRIVLKGVLDVDDARRAVDQGVDGLVVSNHGGRQLDSAPSTVTALPDIAEAVGDKTVVMLDGGVRSGEDVVKALALGARACLLGRARIYPLAARGEAGVSHMLELLRHQITTTLILAGRDSVAGLDRSVLSPG
jgi:L-lactate dehydrogenase (cytochrome)